jgi:hypothetical protein
VKATILFLAIALSAAAQAPADSSSPTNNAGTKKTDTAFHANVIKLLELIDLNHHLEDVLKGSMPEAKKHMMEKCERCTPAFADEWEKRMLARTNIADYSDVYVKVYEKYFTLEDINELIALQKAKLADCQSINSFEGEVKLVDAVDHERDHRWLRSDRGQTRRRDWYGDREGTPRVHETTAQRNRQTVGRHA